MWSIKGGDSTHFFLVRGDVELRIPATEAGLRVLTSILLDLGSSKIGMPGFPTQHQLNEMIERFNRQKEKEPGIRINLKDFGL